MIFTKRNSMKLTLFVKNIFYLHQDQLFVGIWPGRIEFERTGRIRYFDTQSANIDYWVVIDSETLQCSHMVYQIHTCSNKRMIMYSTTKEHLVFLLKMLFIFNFLGMIKKLKNDQCIFIWWYYCPWAFVSLYLRLCKEGTKVKTIFLNREERTVGNIL